MRLRDAQRQKVYNAESVGFRHTNEARRHVNLDEAKEALDILVQEFETQPVTISINRRIKAWGGWYQSWVKNIEVPSNVVPMSTVLHEFAHHLAYHREVGIEGHGGGFTEAMLDVVKAWVGQDVADSLKEAYRRSKCKIGGHHVTEKLEAKKQAWERQEPQMVYIIGYEDVSYYSEGKVPHYFVTTTGWFDEVSRRTYQAKVYKTLGGAERAAKKLHGSVTDYETKEPVAIKVYTTMMRYHGVLNEWQTNAQWDEDHLAEVSEIGA